MGNTLILNGEPEELRLNENRLASIPFFANKLYPVLLRVQSNLMVSAKPPPMKFNYSLSPFLGSFSFAKKSHVGWFDVSLGSCRKQPGFGCSQEIEYTLIRHKRAYIIRPTGLTAHERVANTVP